MDESFKIIKMASSLSNDFIVSGYGLFIQGAAIISEYGAINAEGIICKKAEMIDEDDYALYLTSYSTFPLLENEYVMVGYFTINNSRRCIDYFSNDFESINSILNDLVNSLKSKTDN